jgi:hypothetical protein
MSSAVTLSEFLSDDELPENVSFYSGSYKFGKVYAPSADKVEAFKMSHPSLNCSGSYVGSGVGVHKHQMNWCSIDSYVNNWDSLSREDKLTIEALLNSDLTGNANRFGLKRKDLEAHLLLNIGCDMNNIVNNGKDSVRSNLLSLNGSYSSECLDNRAVDPKTCRRFASRFKKDYDVEKLFKSGFVAYQAVITLNSSVSVAALEAKEKIQLFFRENALTLSKMCHKKKLIPSYMRSHEISVSSILSGLYDPHTHLLFFVQRGTDSEHLRLLEETFNNEFSDRKLEILRNDDLSFKCGKTFASIEKSVDYLFNSYSLASQYLREAREDNLVKLNKATVECYHNLIWLLRADSEHSGVQRFGKSHIPERNSLKTYKHPLLQKKRKSNTIKKALLSKVNLNKLSVHEQLSSNHQGSTIRNAQKSNGAGQSELPESDAGLLHEAAARETKSGSIERASALWYEKRAGRKIWKRRCRESTLRPEHERHADSERSCSKGADATRLQIQLSEARGASSCPSKGSPVNQRKRKRQDRSTADSSKQSKA